MGAEEAPLLHRINQVADVFTERSLAVSSDNWLHDGGSLKPKRPRDGGDTCPTIAHRH